MSIKLIIRHIFNLS